MPSAKAYPLAKLMDAVDRHHRIRCCFCVSHLKPELEVKLRAYNKHAVELSGLDKFVFLAR